MMVRVIELRCRGRVESAVTGGSGGRVRRSGAHGGTVTGLVQIGIDQVAVRVITTTAVQQTLEQGTSAITERSREMSRCVCACVISARALLSRSFVCVLS